MTKFPERWMKMTEGYNLSPIPALERYATDPDGMEWRISLVELGEGYAGEYNPDDPNDAELVRFDIYRRKTEEDRWDADADGWYSPQDSSYCTLTRVDDPQGINHLLDTLENMVLTGATNKRDWQEASWIGKNKPKYGWYYSD